VAITLWVVGWVIDLLDSVLEVLPAAAHPNSYLPVPIPRLGAVVTLALILFLGILTRGVATRRILAAWDNVLLRIPIFRGVYNAVQKLVQTFLGQSQTNRQVVMIEYPRKGIYTVGFAMGRAWHELEKQHQAPLINVFIPTTPNPTIRLLPAFSRQRSFPHQHEHGRSVKAHHLRRADHARRKNQEQWQIRKAPTATRRFASTARRATTILSMRPTKPV
jgi:uncharacterized membrane protein